MTYYNARGEETLVMDYADNLTIDLKTIQPVEGGVDYTFLDAHGASSGVNLFDADSHITDRTKSNVVRYLVDYSEEGFVREI